MIIIFYCWYLASIFFEPCDISKDVKTEIHLSNLAQDKQDMPPSHHEIVSWSHGEIISILESIVLKYLLLVNKTSNWLRGRYTWAQTIEGSLCCWWWLWHLLAILILSHFLLMVLLSTLAKMSGTSGFPHFLHVCHFGTLGSRDKTPFPPNFCPKKCGS